MGFRNPFRFTVDPKTGWVLMGDYGPDAGTTNANRGPQGTRRVQRASASPATTAGRTASATTSPYNDYDFATSTSGPKFNCAAPVNNSPNNTGLTNLPPAIGADAWMGYTETDPRFPELGTRRRPDGRPALPLRRRPRLDRKFPAFYDSKWFFGEWNNGWIKTVDAQRATATSPTASTVRRSARATSARWTSSSAPTARCT